jgi:hypothetical protein
LRTLSTPAKPLSAPQPATLAQSRGANPFYEFVLVC